MIQIPYKKFLPGLSTPQTRDEFVEFNPSLLSNGPLISCVMVTRGSINLIKQSYKGFKSQSWANKELVIVCDEVSDTLRALVSSDSDHIKLIEVQKGLSLGELRNISIAHSRGEYICQWDDDDLYDPRRLSASMKVLIDSSSEVVFLNRWIMWWESRNLASISSRRLWEGSMLALRSVIPIYSAIRKGEDSLMVRSMCKHHSIAVMDFPELYCYRVTGENTWDESHFEALFNASTHKFSDEEWLMISKLPCFEFS
jgi:glycosyltransferase involved in cell wall biosynthesis